MAHDDVVLVPFQLTHHKSPSTSPGINLSANETQVGEPPGGQRHHVEVGEHQGAEGDPREGLVPGVDLADLRPEPVPHRVFGEVLEPAAGDVAARVTRQRVGPQQHDVGDQDDVAQAETEAAVFLGERQDRVVGVDDRDDRGAGR